MTGGIKNSKEFGRFDNGNDNSDGITTDNAGRAIRGATRDSSIDRQPSDGGRPRKRPRALQWEKG